jgi:CubicO group peptidase (beta-lactamase class C family)
VTTESTPVNSATADSALDYIRHVETPQSPNRGGFDGLALHELMSWFHIPGMSLAVIEDFKIHWAKGYGVADVETGRPVDTRTLFQAGSISKPVSAMALLKLVQEGRLSLDVDINEILQSWKLPDSPFTRERRVTPRMLASHTSGLGDGFGFPGYEPTVPLPTILQILQGQPPSNVGALWMERPPLVAMKYSGGGSTLLQLAVVDTVKRPFPDFLRECVFEPVGMTDSGFDQPLSLERDSNAARAHGSGGESTGSKWNVYPELFAAGLWTTAIDLAKFSIEVQLSVHGRSNRILSRSMVQEMLNPVGVGDFAVGFRVQRHGEGWYMAHTGATRGFCCNLIAHKVKGYGLVAMTNGNRSPDFLEEIKKRIERVYGWDSLDKPLPR